MAIEVNAQHVVAYLLEQNRQLVAEIAMLRAVLGLGNSEEGLQKVEE